MNRQIRVKEEDVEGIDCRFCGERCNASGLNEIELALYDSRATAWNDGINVFGLKAMEPYFKFICICPSCLLGKGS